MRHVIAFYPLLVLLAAALPANSETITDRHDSPAEARMRAAGLVDIHDLDSAFAVHLVYATPYNFTGRVLYADLHKAFLLPELAERLVKANRRLRSIRPDLNLLIYDAARPLAVQRTMWNMVKGTPLNI